MSKALTASIVIGAALSASYNNVFKTAKQKQYELSKAFADTNKKLKASDAVVEYKRKLTALKRKYTETGGGSRRMAAGIADLEKRYRAAKRELKSYGVAVGDAVKAQKRLAQESKKLSKALESGAVRERNKALRQELHAGALVTKTAAVTAAQWAWNVALNANPIGLVVGAVAALAGAAWLIYDNWQPIPAWLQDKFAWVGDVIG